MDSKPYIIELIFNDTRRIDRINHQSPFMLNRVLNMIDSTQIRIIQYLYHVSKNLHSDKKHIEFDYKSNIFNVLRPELIRWDHFKNLLNKKNQRALEILNHSSSKFDCDQRDKLSTATTIFNASLDSLMYSFINDELDISDLNYLEREYLTKKIKQLIRESTHGMYHIYNCEYLRVVGAQQLSPVTIILEVIGAIGSVYSLLIFNSWFLNYRQHSKIDIRNKKIATETAEIILKRLKDNDIDIRPEAIEELIKNANIRPGDIPALTSFKIIK